MVDGSNAALGGVTVKAYNASTIYQATSAGTTGAYKIFAPAGSYTFVVVGKDTATDYKNISQTITVLRGQAVGPIDDKNGQTAWAANENKLGLSVGAFDGNDKSISGTALAGTTVWAFVYNNSNPIIYNHIGTSAKVSKSSTTSTTGAFKITLTSYYPNQMIDVIVKDTSLNSYENTSYITTPVASESMRLTGDSAATITTVTRITMHDSATTALDAYLASKLGSTITATSSAVTGTLTFTKNTHYTVASGAITFKAGVLATAGAYNITVTATNYNNGYVTQTIKPSKIAPTAFTSLTKDVKAVTSSGATKITIGDAKANSSNIYGIIVTSTSAAGLYYKFNPLTGYTTYTSGTEIVGVDPITNKYVDLFELTPPTTTNAATIVRYTRYTMSTALIKSPVVSSIVATGSSVIITYDDGTLNTTAPAAAAYTVKVKTPTDGTAYVTRTVSGVAVSGKVVTLTLGKALAKEDAVQITYAVPASNPVKDSYGNKVAAIASTATVTNSTAQGPTLSTAVASAAASTITLTFSGSLTNGAVDKAAFTVKKGTGLLTVASAAVSGTTVTLTITAGSTAATKLVSGDSTVTVTYKASGTTDMTNGALVGNINAHAVSCP
jgi:hypothetical protein